MSLTTAATMFLALFALMALIAAQDNDEEHRKLYRQIVTTDNEEVKLYTKCMVLKDSRHRALRIQTIEEAGKPTFSMENTNELKFHFVAWRHTNVTDCCASDTVKFVAHIRGRTIDDDYLYLSAECGHPLQLKKVPGNWKIGADGHFKVERVGSDTQAIRLKSFSTGNADSTQLGCYLHKTHNKAIKATHALNNVNLTNFFNFIPFNVIALSKFDFYLENVDCDFENN